MLVLKLVILAVSLWFLYIKLISEDGWKGFEAIELSEIIKQPLLWLVIILMAINWGIEALKWKILVNRFEAISYYTAIKSIVTGVFISLFVNILVPNRLGEFAGRILYVRLNKIKAALITSIGSFAQFIATALFGAIAFSVFSFSNISDKPLEKYEGYLLVSALVLLVGLIILLYLNINVLSWVLRKPKFLRRFKKITSVFYFYNTSRLVKVLVLSILRYGVFCSQFILLLWVCGVDITVAQGLMAVPIIFLVQTVVPSNMLSDLVIRGAASTSFLGYFSDNNAGILAAAYLLWAINIFIPGVLGAISFSIFKYREGNGSSN